MFQARCPTGVGRTADIAINGIKAELKTLEGVKWGCYIWNSE